MNSSPNFIPKPIPLLGRYISVLLVISMIILADTYILLQFSRTYDILLLVLITALVSGLSSLFVLNSISSLYYRLSRALPRGLMRQDYTTQIILCCIAAALMILPGLISFIIGGIIYTKPLRVILSQIITRHFPRESSLTHEKLIELV